MQVYNFADDATLSDLSSMLIVLENDASLPVECFECSIMRIM